MESRRSYASFQHPQIRSALLQLNQLAPRFELGPGDVSVMATPSEFYETLKKKILAADKRIFLATLYIGKTEHDLINTLDAALAKNPDLTVYILTDALRGTREAPETCSASLLAPLVTKFSSRRVKLRMYHTPKLTGVKKKLIPRRFNEAWGLQHMKLYGFDDEIILSGANLSRDYFTNRQDRYALFKSRALTDYFFRIHEAVSGLSFAVEPRPDTKQGFELEWTQHPAYVPNPLEDAATFAQIATERLAPLLKPNRSEARELSIAADGAPVTYVYPVSQFSQILNPDTSTEMPALARVLSLLGADRFDWTMTAGYFNVHPVFADKLLKTFPTQAQVITASPYANGFYKSKGVSGLLPGVYSHLARNFLDRVAAADKADCVRMLEWRRGTVNVGDGWSYHAKGMWASLPREPSDEKAREPFVTVIGSSNYTRRAYTHDLESNAIVFTQDPDLQQQLGNEIAHLSEHAAPITAADYDAEDRRPDWRQKLFARVMADKL